MYLLYLLNVVVLLSFSIGASSSPVAQGTTSTCNARDIAIVKRTANEPTYFCTWWNSDTRTRTPFMELTVSQVNSACKCISKPSKDKRAATLDHPVLSKGLSVQSCSVEMSKQFTEPWHFCKFYNAYPRTTSPFRKYSAKSLLALCDCVEGKSVSPITMKSSSKKTSVTKTTIKSSSTKSSGSKKPTSSSSKKTSSSSKKSSLSSSSGKKSASSSSHKSTPWSAKSTKTSSRTKPVSTTKSSTSSVRKTTSSSNMVSSTKKTSSSTNSKTSSSASRGSSSKLLTSTSIKPSSSTKSSSKSLSSSQASVHITTSSKSSSGLSRSSKFSTTKLSDSSGSSLATTSKSTSSSSSSSTTKSFTSTSSTIPAKSPTVRTDGQFYLRVANTTAPPNDYYVRGDKWVEIIGAFGIGNSGAFGQYGAGNPRCSYDENFLLSCITSSDNGTSTQVIFEYKQYGSHFQLRGLSKPDGLPTLNLYVELVESSAPSTTSSNGSTTSLTTLSTAVNTPSPSTHSNTTSSLNISSTIPPIPLSTASSDASSNASATALPTVIPTCTLIPHIPNAGFEDGKNQTAWSTTGAYFGSWAPTTTNPYDGTLSGQVTFTEYSKYGRVYLYLTNTLSNLCPGFNYSISYNSLCDVPYGNCFFTIFASESHEDEMYSDVTTPATGWLSKDDITEFTAAKSTTTLYVYVGTAMPYPEDVGNVFLDSFSIALIGDKTRVYQEG